MTYCTSILKFLAIQQGRLFQCLKLQNYKPKKKVYRYFTGMWCTFVHDRDLQTRLTDSKIETSWCKCLKFKEKTKLSFASLNEYSKQTVWNHNNNINKYNVIWQYFISRFSFVYNFQRFSSTSVLDWVYMKVGTQTW